MNDLVGWPCRRLTPAIKLLAADFATEVVRIRKWSTDHGDFVDRPTIAGRGPGGAFFGSSHASQYALPEAYREPLSQ